MLSSVHSARLREQLAAEMQRVLRPGGIVVSYDVAPVPLLPRVVNRAFSLPGRLRAQAASAAARPGAAPAKLTSVVPLDEAALRALFQSLEFLEITRLTAYRPLVERLLRHPLALAILLRLRPFATARLFVARAPGGSAGA